MPIFSFFNQLTLSGVSLSPDKASTLVYLIITTLSIIFLALIAIIAVISIHKSNQTNTTNQPKQLTCKLCDNHQFTKIEDFIVCDNCGCKYSVETAKKLLSDNIATKKKSFEGKKTFFYILISVLIIFIISTVINCIRFLAPLSTIKSSESHSSSVDPSNSERIILDINNYRKYITIKTEISPANYSSDPLNPGYQEINYKFTISPNTSTYIFNNIQVTLSANVMFRQSNLSSSHHSECQDTKTVMLDSDGNGTITFTFKTNDYFVISNIENIHERSNIDYIYGELTPIN